MAGAGAPPLSTPCRTATASPPRTGSRKDAPGQSDQHHGLRLKAGFALGEVPSHHHRVKIESPDNATRIVTLADGAVPADRDFELTLEAGRGEGAIDRAVPRACRRLRLPARLRHLAQRPSRPTAKAAAARSRVRDRQFRLDGRHIDRSGQSKPDLRARLGSQAVRPFQRHPFRRHYGRSVPGPGTSRRRRMSARRPSFVSACCRPAAAQRWCRRCARR